MTTNHDDALAHYGAMLTEVRLRNDPRVEDAIVTLVERVHYATGGAFATNGHSIILVECVRCGDLFNKIREALLD